MEPKKRRYPVGIQTFSEIIRGGYVYVDKTDLVWQLQDGQKYVFLSRPRRFGKSLLSSTLRSFFEGRKELFLGLKVMELEQEWKASPVIHLDLSLTKGQESAAALRSRLMLLLKDYAAIYGHDEDEFTPGSMLQGLIKRAYKQTHSQVVVIIDEYDAPLLEVLHEEEDLSQFRKVMQEFYVPLKACDPYLRFCFITGITKFSQLSIFSSLNNMLNVTLNPRYSAICGITEKELTTALHEDICQMATEYGCSPEEMHAKLKAKYDGYHFSEKSEEVYNPFSLMTAFLQQKLGNYWFDTGTPSYLIHQMQRFRTNITAMDNLEVPVSAFDRTTEAMTNALPLLYQSGYLTIKGYEPDGEIYTLSMPNQEVRFGYADGLLPAYVGLEGEDVQAGFALKFWRALKQHDLAQALRELQAYLAGIPYVEGFKKKLAEAATAEGFYEYTFYLIFSMLNVYVRTHVKCAGGRTDVVVLMPDATYVLELKTNGTAQSALDQINQKGYAIPYQTNDQRVVKAGIHFNTDTRTIDDWVIENQVHF